MIFSRAAWTRYGGCVSLRRTALLLVGLAGLVGCVRAPAPYWVTDPSLAGPYPAPAHGPAQGMTPYPAMTAPPGPGVVLSPPLAQGPHGGSAVAVPGSGAPTAGAAPPAAVAPAATPGASAPEPRRPSAGAASPSNSTPVAAGGTSYRVPIPPLTKSAPAVRYAELTPAACRAELKQRNLPLTPEKKQVRGIADPVRITGDLNGVRIISPPSPSPFGLLDCRLGLALDDLTKLLASHGIAQIYIGSMYREGAKIAHRGHKSQHGYGLAMDILSLRHQDGRLLKVERDWHGGVGDASCGPDAVIHEPDASSILLRNVICAVARAHIFHHMLTPGSNRAHRDHFHFDVKRGANYQYVR